MTRDPYKQHELREFLLGEASEEQRSALEERYLADDEFSAELGAAEDELIETYLRNELSAGDRRKFENAFLAQPRRRERVLMMKGVIAAATAEAALKPAPTPSLWNNLLALFRFQNSFARYALAAAVLVLLAFGALFVFNRLRRESDERFAHQQPVPTATVPGAASPLASPEPSQPAPTPAPSVSPIKSTAPSPTPNAEPTGPTFATIFLRPSLVRDPRAANKLAVGPSVKEIRLQLNLERNDYKSYTVRIATVEGREVWKADSIRARGSGAGTFLALSVAANRLPAGDYLVEVSGLSDSRTSESVASYFFSLNK